MNKISVQVDNLGELAECVSRNGTHSVNTMVAETEGENVRLRFISTKLHRSLHGGALISVEAMDRLAAEWISKRSRIPKDRLLRLEVAIREIAAIADKELEEK